MRHAIFKATLIAGTLDILSAFLFADLAGVSAPSVLRFIASGPFGDMANGPPFWLWIIIGLAIHFALIACMATAYMLAARYIPMLTRSPLFAGVIYGLLLWILMYWIVRPIRWPDLWLPDIYSTKSMGEIAWSIGSQLFSHCILVGQPIAIIIARQRASSNAA